MTTLTDEQCDEFRRMPCSFNDMIRAAYRAGQDETAYRAGQSEMRERAAEVCAAMGNADSIRALPLDEQP
jgi:hypothetical protein